MVIDRTIFDEPHCQSLEILAAQELAEDNAAAAFKLADRRCRIQPPPEPHCYVLRAEALYRLGEKTAAIIDLAKAIEIVPNNVAANRRMLAWADGIDQMRAALAIVNHDSNAKALSTAIEVLRKSGQRNIAHVIVLEDAIEGWAAWQGEAFAEISIVDRGTEICEKFEADVFHPLAGHGHAANFCIRRPKSTDHQLVTLATADGVFHSTRAAANHRAQKTRVIWPQDQNSHPQQVTVIVPAYGGHEATRVCIDRLRNGLKSHNHRAILINDATPDPRIANHLAKCATDSSIEVIVNDHNLGFIGSVNNALEGIRQGDIIILNSDTIVPGGFIDRLADVARSSPDIGTVTPLSNNGEFVSFPIPNTANPLGSCDEIERLDAIAAKANSGQIVDIPSGIGFCLYVTRRCLDAVGPLSDDFARGYLEDVDFCLRAREEGFRNVCAPSVYVGHAGSKSFGQEKRSLVVRNLRILEQRFPRHRSECAAFIEADPLRSAREAIERTAIRSLSHIRLLVTGPGVVGATARQRASETSSAATLTWITEVRVQADGIIVRIINAQGGIPQSLQYDICASSDRQLLTDFLKGNAIARIEFIDPASTPCRLVDLLVKLGIPYDIYVADAGLIGTCDDRLLAAAASVLPAEKETSSQIDLDRDDWIDRWQQIAEGAERLIVPCSQAEVFIRSVLSPRVAGKIERDYKKYRRPLKRKQKKSGACHLGLVPVRSCVREQWLMSEIARQLKRIKSDISITVIGAPLDDIGLMRTSSAFVTGAIDPDEFEHLVDALAVDHLFVSATQPLFAHPILSVAFSSDIPTAYFDWSAGKCASRKSDLAIDPQLSLVELVDELSGWLEEPCTMHKR